MRGVEAPADAGAGRPTARSARGRRHRARSGSGRRPSPRGRARRRRSPGPRRARPGRRARASSGLVLVRARSASRTRSRCAGCPPPSALVDGVGQAEAGRDQRGVGLDVGAHHEDVARLEGRVVLEQTDQHLAQHVDLAGRAVAGVHLQAAVGRVVDPAGPLLGAWARGWRAGRAGGAPAGWSAPRRARRPARRAGPAAPGCGRAPGCRGPARRAAGGRRARPSGPPSGGPGRPVPRAVAAGLPQRRRGLRQPQVHVAGAGQGAEQRDLARRAAGCGRRARAARAGRGRRRRLPARPRCGPAARRAGRRAPARAGGATARAARPGRRAATRRAPSVSRPSRQSVTSAGRCTAYAAISPARRRATDQRRSRRSSASCPERPWPRWWARVAHHGSSSEASMAPSSGQTSRSGSHGSSRSRSSSSETSERGVRNRTPAQMPSPPRGPAAEGVREPLRHPPLHALGGHHHDLLGERVVQGHGEQLAEAVDEPVGARGAVEVERHGGSIARGTDTRGGPRGPGRRQEVASASCRSASSSAIASGLSWKRR